MNTPVLIDRANDVTTFASTDSGRYVLNGVHFTEKYTEACNGRILIRCPYPSLAHEDFPKNGHEVKPLPEKLIIPSQAIKECVKALPKRTSLPVLACVEIGMNGEQVEMRSTDLNTQNVGSCRPIEGTYPITEQVIPNDTAKVTITLSAHYLQLIAAYAIKHATNDQAPVKLLLTDEFSAVRFSVEISKDRVASGVLLPMRMS